MLKCKFLFKQRKCDIPLINNGDVCMCGDCDHYNRNVNADICSVCDMAVMVDDKCVHGEYTEELFNTHGCKTCGKPTVVICSHPAVVGKRRNSKSCNHASCKYFKYITKY